MANDKTGNGASEPGLFGVLDLSGPLQDVYKAMLSSGETSVEELAKELPAFSDVEIKTHLNLLCRLDYLEKIPAQGGPRFRLKGRLKGGSTLSEDIWSKIDAGGASPERKEPRNG